MRVATTWSPPLTWRPVGAATAAGRRLRRLATWALIALAGLVGTASADPLLPEGGRDDDTIAAMERRKAEGWRSGGEVVAVRDRDRPEYIPLGLRVGNFLLFPSLETRAVYDDNVFLTASHPKADWRVELEPVLRLRSMFPRHVLDVSIGAKHVAYARHDHLDYTDAHARARLSLHIDHAHTLAFNLHTALEHQDLLDPFVPVGGRERVPVWRNRASMGLTRNAGRLYGTVGATIESLDFHDITDLAGNRIEQDSRDMLTVSGEIKVGYRFSPGFEFETKARMLRQLNRGDATRDADASGADLLAGVKFETGRLLHWRILGGYGWRDFDQASQPTVSTYLAEAEVKWLATQRFNVTLSARRAFMEATGLSAFGAIETRLSARADAELLHNLVLNVGAEWRRADFIGIDRLDDAIIGRIGLEYHLNRNWLLSLGYEHMRRDSTLDAFDVTRNVFSIGAKLRF